MKSKILIFFFVSNFFYSAAQPTLQWQKCYGGTNSELATCIQQTTDGGYIIAGTSYSDTASWDYWIVKINNIGNIQWQKSYGGSGIDQARSIQQTTDGGYIVAGVSNSTDGDVTGNHGLSDCWIVKIDTGGAIQWQKSYGGTKIDDANSIQQTIDGGYIVAASSYSNDGDVTGLHGVFNFDYWVLKLDSGGNIQWQKCYGGTGEDAIPSIQQTTNGGYIIAGQSWSNDGDVTGNHGIYDYWVVKIDNGGVIEWQKSYGGSDGDLARCMDQTTDGGYIVGGRSFSNDGDVTGHHGAVTFEIDYWVVKLDSSGNMEWQKSLGGTDYDDALSLQQTIDGGYIIAGSSNSTDGDVTGNHGSYDYWLVKLDTNGNIQWQKCYGGSGDDEPFSLQQTTDAEYIVAGYSLSNDGDVSGNNGLGQDFWVVKLASYVGINQNNAGANFISVYPNPFSTQLTFSLEDNEQTTVSFYNFLGQQILQQTITNSTTINTVQFADGIYFYELRNDKRTVKNGKVLKQ